MYGCVQYCSYHTGIYSEYEYILLLYRGGVLTTRPNAMSVSGYIWMLHVSCVVWISTKSLRKTMFPHYGDVIMDAIASQITSLTIVYTVVYSDADQRNIKAPRHWPFCGEFTGDRWIPRTNGQLRGKCFHLMTSSWFIICNVWETPQAALKQTRQIGSQCCSLCTCHRNYAIVTCPKLWDLWDMRLTITAKHFL